MIRIEETERFSTWLSALRIQRLAFGNPGDIAPIGDGLSEMRIHYGPGYRIYLMQQGNEYVLLLGGGDKSMQHNDIIRARALAKDYRK
jgi:putative addiction module killer protein